MISRNPVPDIRHQPGVMMNVVFLSPHFPPNFRHFCRHLKELGVNVLGVADTAIDEECRSYLSEFFNVLDMHNYDNVLRGLGYYTYNFGKLDRVESHNEYWLETEAQLRTDFNVFGFKANQMSKIKRKTEMKEVFQSIGLNVARGKICSDEKQLRDFIKEVGYPVVAKPDIGVGAAATYCISCEPELKHFLQDRVECDYIVEEFLKGKIVTFDGLVDRDGELIFSTSHRYSDGIMEIVNTDTAVHYWSQRTVPDEVRKAGLAILKAFDVRERFFHFEFFDDNGVIRPLEVNMRPPGGLTLDMFNFAFDFDCYRLWAELVATGDCKRFKEQPYFVMYVARKDHIPYKLSHEEAIRQVSDLLVHEERIAQVFSRAIGNHGYILRHEKLEPLMEAVSIIQA